MTKCFDKFINEEISKFMNEWMTKCFDKFINEFMKEWIKNIFKYSISHPRMVFMICYFIQTGFLK